jgi:hypothetical protein
MTKQEFDLPFEELPLIVELGFEAALINGSVTIGYHQEGEWSVRGISLDGTRELSTTEKSTAARKAGAPFMSSYVRSPVTLCRDRHRWLYDAIVDQLENGRFAALVREAVATKTGNRRSVTAQSQPATPDTQARQPGA